MKRIILFLAMAIMVMACNRKGTSIKVNKTTDRYELVAEYPKKRTEKLEEYLKTIFENDSNILNEEKISTGKEIKLANSAVFYLRYNPGKLEMEMLIERNNTIGHQYFDKVAKGVKQTLN